MASAEQRGDPVTAVLREASVAPAQRLDVREQGGNLTTMKHGEGNWEAAFCTPSETSTVRAATRESLATRGGHVERRPRGKEVLWYYLGHIASALWP